MPKTNWKQFEADRDRMLESVKVYAKPFEKKPVESSYEKACKEHGIAPSWTQEGADRVTALNDQGEFVRFVDSLTKTQRKKFLGASHKVSEAMYQDYLRGNL